MYYNQYDYAHIPYPASGYPNATVRSGGCGVCCASMAVEELTTKPWPPELSAAYAIKVGGRVPGGTDMAALGKAIASKFGLKFRQAQSIHDVVSAIQYSGAVVIANTKGGNAGLFSDEGHFIVLANIRAPCAVVWDPGMYAGKYSKPWRKNKVQIYGNDIYVTPEVLDADIRKDYAAYFIFQKGDDPLIKDITVRAGDQEVLAKLIDGVTWVPLRAIIDAIKSELTVTWTPENGAEVNL